MVTRNNEWVYHSNDREGSNSVGRFLLGFESWQSQILNNTNYPLFVWTKLSSVDVMNTFQGITAIQTFPYLLMICSVVHLIHWENFMKREKWESFRFLLMNIKLVYSQSSEHLRVKTPYFRTSSNISSSLEMNRW